MGESLLTAKLLVPLARSGLVARPRLLEKLQSGHDRNLVLLSAPAGFGKTTLVSDWVRNIQPRIPTAWLSLEIGENDPVLFWEYFIGALKTLKPAVGSDALSLLHSPQPLAIEAILKSLVNEVNSMEEDFILVLDDYHFIQSQPICAGIAFMLEHIPAKMHLVIATRIDPELPLARYRAKGTMLEIGADDLRFTSEEAAELLEQLQHHPLSREEVLALNVRAEGWVTGLKMAALSLGQQKDVKSFLENFTGSQRYIMDYLMEEVLLCQTEEVQEFLLKTSVLERLTAPLCDFVCGHNSSQEMLAKLEQANLFLVPLDESRRWYRYHHLFSELLRHQFELIPAPGEVARLHQKASQWYEEQGFIDDSIQHALSARDWGRAMKLIYDQSEARFSRGEWNIMFDWLRLIPEDTLRTFPRLYARYANALITLGQPGPAATVLSYLETISLEDTNLRGEVALFQTILARRQGDLPRTKELAEKSLALLAPDNLAMRARASFILGWAHMVTPNLQEASSRLVDAYEMGRRSGYHWIAAGSAAAAGEIFRWRGKLHQALEICRQGVDLAGRSPAAANSRGVIAMVQYEWNNLQEAAQDMQLAVEVSELGGQAEARIGAHHYLAQICLTQGNMPGMIAENEKADQAALHPSVSAAFKAYHAANRTLIALRQNDLASALIWGDRLSEYSGVLTPELRHIPPRLLIARGEKGTAAQHLERLYERAMAAGQQGIAIQILVYRALAEATPARALTFLGLALEMGQPEGFVRTFVDEGKLLAPLLRKASSERVAPEYAGRLLNVIEAEERQRRASTGAAASGPTCGPLSEREMEILHLVEAGVSNRQIAERLIISLSTAKTHVHNISEKLNARTRTHAVARARELKLI